MTCSSLLTALQRPGRDKLNLERVSARNLAENEETLTSQSLAGDAFVRELDVSKITLRLRAKEDKKGEANSDATIAKLTGSTLDTLKRCLVSSAIPSHVDPSNSWLLVQTYRTRIERRGWFHQQGYRELEIHSG